MDDPDTCPICFSSLRQESQANLDSCDHRFCRSCITTWSKKQLKCPLCKRAFTTMTITPQKGSPSMHVFDEPTETIGPNAAEGEVDMSGLDHDFYIMECIRLIDNCKDAKRRLFEPPNGIFFTRGRSVVSTPAWKAIDQVHTQLQQIEQDLRNEARFDPTELWQRLSWMDHILKDLWSGRVTFLNPDDAQAQENATVLRFSADDAMHKDDYGDDDYYDHYDYEEYDYDLEDETDFRRTSQTSSRNKPRKK